MGARIVYLIPDGEGPPAGAYRRAVVRCLRGMGVIDDEEDEDGYPPGPLSLQVLARAAGADDAFESCQVYAARRPRLVPEMPAVSPRCPACRRKLEDEFYAAVAEAEEAADEAGGEPDYAPVRVACPKCNSRHALDRLDDRVGVHLARRFVCLDDVQGKLSRPWLAAFVERTGIGHRVYEYQYT